MNRLPPQLLLLVVLVALVAAAPAGAGVHVPRGEVVREIRVIGTDVRIDGRATGPVVVIAGDLTVGPTGQAANITVVGGRLTTLPGARLSGDLFHFGGPLPSLAGWRLALLLLVLLGLRTLLVGLTVITAAGLARTTQAAALVESARLRPARTLSAGVLASAGLLAASALLALTVIGLPAALMIAGALILALLVGVAVAITIPVPQPPQRAVFLTLAIPLLGDALLALATALGVGVLLRRLSRREIQSDRLSTATS